jgi:hypothetical protein
MRNLALVIVSAAAYLYRLPRFSCRRVVEGPKV